MRKTYRLPYLEDPDGILDVPRAAIDVAPWGADYRPRSEAAAAVTRDAIEVLLLSWEESPRAVETAPNAEVYEDSCLEFFLIPFPEASAAYLNFEFNSLGTLLLGFGPSTTKRDRLPEAEGSRFRIRTLRLDGERAWAVRFRIPFDFLEGLYGVQGMGPGHRFRGNFQKCGDRCETPHFLAWNPIDAPSPDFHRPGDFGDLEVDSRLV